MRKSRLRKSLSLELKPGNKPSVSLPLPCTQVLKLWFLLLLSAGGRLGLCALGSRGGKSNPDSVPPTCHLHRSLWVAFIRSLCVSFRALIPFLFICLIRLSCLRALYSHCCDFLRRPWSWVFSWGSGYKLLQLLTVKLMYLGKRKKNMCYL